MIALDFVTLNERLFWASGKLISSTCFCDCQVIMEIKGCRQMPLDSRCILEEDLMSELVIESKLLRDVFTARTA